MYALQSDAAGTVVENDGAATIDVTRKVGSGPPRFGAVSPPWPPFGDWDVSGDTTKGERWP
jgi:hypothetical protein